MINHPQMQKDNLQDYLFDVLNTFANLDKNSCSLQIDEIMKQKYPNLFIDKDFSLIKKHFNDLLLSEYSKLETIINNSEDPLLQAMKFSMVANYIDFSAFNNIDEDLLSSLLNESSKQIIDNSVYTKFKSDLSKSKQLLILTDNCGEIVLDKLMLSVIKKNYPNLNITCMVKDVEISNDASIVDAKQVKMDEVCSIVTNGLNLPGTMLNRMPEDKALMLKNADIIISKGQANAETLLNCGFNIYYMLLCKCDYYASLFKCEKMQIVFHRELDGLN